jgi:hypothetical protein
MADRSGGGDFGSIGGGLPQRSFSPQRLYHLAKYTAHGIGVLFLGISFYNYRIYSEACKIKLDAQGMGTVSDVEYINSIMDNVVKSSFVGLGIILSFWASVLVIRLIFPKIKK